MYCTWQQNTLHTCDGLPRNSLRSPPYDQSTTITMHNSQYGDDVINSTYNLRSPPENSPEVSNYSHSNCWYIAMNTTFECLPQPFNCGDNHLARMTNSIAAMF